MDPLNASQMAKLAAVRDARKSKGLSLEDVADRVGISVSQLSRIERGEREARFAEIQRLSEILDLPVEDVGSAADQTKRRNTAKVMGRIGAGAEIMPEHEQVPDEGLYEIEVMFPIPEEAIAFEVVGDSMWPRYDPGDVIVCWRQGTNLKEIVGWEAAVQTKDGRRYLKRVLAGSRPGAFDLESHNAPTIRGVKLEWAAEIGTVVRSNQWRKLDQKARTKLMKKATARP